MQSMWHKPVLVAALTAVVSLGWTGGNGAVGVAALENELVSTAGDCTAMDGHCPEAVGNVLTHWISRTNSGNLFLVLQTDCQTTERCASWFVERTAHGAATRLNIEGLFRVLHSS